MSELILLTIAVFVIPSLIGSLLPARYVNWATRYLFGLIMIGLVVSFGQGLGFAKNTVGIIIPALAAAGAIRLIREKNFPKPPLRLIPAYVVAAIVLTALLLYATSEVFNTPLSAWDAIAIWFNKARAIYYWEPLSLTPLSNYPNLGPSLWAYAMSIAGLQEHFGRVVFAIIYVLWSASLLDLKNKNWIAKVVYLVVWAAVSLFLVDYGVWNGYQDAFLGLTAATSALLLGRILWLHGEEKYTVRNVRWDLALGLFFAGVLYLIKNEGLLVGLIIFASFAFTSLVVYRNKWRLVWAQKKALFLSVGLFALPIVSWGIVQVLNKIDPSQVQGNAFTLKGLLSIPSRLDTFPQIAKYFAADFKTFGMLVGAAAIASLVSLFVDRRRSTFAVNIFLWLFVAMHTAFVAVVFLATNADLAWHLSTAFDRLMSHHVYVFGVILLVNLTIALKKAMSSLPPQLS